MEELVQDLASALDQSSEQTKLDQLWEEMVLSPLRQRRQVRRRRGRKRRCADVSLMAHPHHPRPHHHHHHHPHPHGQRGCLSQASESSLDEASHRDHSALARFTGSTAVSHSDSDDMVTTRRWPWSISGGRTGTDSPMRNRGRMWAEPDSITGNTPGGSGRPPPLRRRRKVKRMTSEDVTVSLQHMLRVSGVQDRDRRGERSYRSARLRKGATGSWTGTNRKSGGGRRGKERSSSRGAMEQREASDENMSEGESSSVSSSDPGLFTNDEGRQGDDEQSDWFFEGECVGTGMGAVPGLLGGWDLDKQPGVEDKPLPPSFLLPARPSQRGYHARLNRTPGVAARCARRGRRRLPNKDNRIPVFVERRKPFSTDTYRRDFWLPSIGKRERSQTLQYNSLCPLAVYPFDMVPESSAYPRCTSSICRTRQTNVHLGLLCTGDIKRRKKISSLPTSTPACILSHKDGFGEEAPGPRHTTLLESAGASGGPGHTSLLESGGALGGPRHTSLLESGGASGGPGHTSWAPKPSSSCQDGVTSGASTCMLEDLGETD